MSKVNFKNSFYVLLFFCIPTLLIAQKTKIQFTDVTHKAGIDFNYTFGDDSYVNILESSGSGVTVFDYNNDGFMDLYLLNGKYLEGISDADGKKYQNYHNELYKNNGNGTFTKVTQKSGLAGNNWGEAAGAIDLDHDGFQDLYVLNYGPNVFYHNNGNGTFTDITSKLGLQGPDKLNGFTKWSIGVSFFDYNLDGRLDAMVGNFLAFDPKYISTQTPGMMPHPSEYKGQASMLYEQQKDGKFVDVTKKEGLYYPDSKCMGLTVYDYDNDGDLDIFQANDHQLNFLFKNENGTFKNVGVASGVAANSQGDPTGSMHATIGDVDGDGLIDILVADLRYGALYKNLGNGLFKDITQESGVAQAISGKGSWGTAFVDFDNDGDLDIVATNGTAEVLKLQYPLLLENDGKGHFRNVGAEYGSYFSTKRSGRGLAVWDFDNDGDMDIIISHLDKIATPSLLRNDGGNKNHWLGLILKGKEGQASTIAAKVIVSTENKKQVLINQWTTGYLSNSDPRLHIGLGKQNQIDTLEINWSDGTKEVYKNIVANHYITILQGKGIIKN
ncbi:CRTAC1 family protein [Lutibacter sp.]|uniref:CRTAC1 family protein n=1 Tax=Lutibacter sp. TaxID=1925666 RepID=UPI0025C4D686|nr:CRTAC1 family protein [Lutibacter sp.]MCF6180897.1 CRTAC1 family protein [Lutibacter sp.]